MSQVNASATAPACRVCARFWFAAACLVAAALLVTLPGRVNKATDSFKEKNIIAMSKDTDQAKPDAAAEEEEQEAPSLDKLQSMIDENKALIGKLEPDVAQLIKDKKYGEAAAAAINISMLQDQNARNQELWDLVQDTKKALDAGIYSHSDALLRDVISNKCNALTQTKIAKMQIDLKAAIDTDEHEEADNIIAQLRPLQAKCTSYAEAMAAIRAADHAGDSNKTEAA